MKSTIIVLLTFMVLSSASFLPNPNEYDYDAMGAYMFGYGVYSNENDQKQNFGQKEHRNDNQVMGEWYARSDGLIAVMPYMKLNFQFTSFVAKVNYGECGLRGGTSQKNPSSSRVSTLCQKFWLEPS